MDTVKFIFGSLNVAEDKSDNTFMVLAKESETKIIKKKDFLFGEELSCDFIFTNYYIARVEEAKFLLLPVVIPNSKLEMDNLINKLSDEFVLTHMKQ